jgi:hypothetical protein
MFSGGPELIRDYGEEDEIHVDANFPKFLTKIDGLETPNHASGIPGVKR